MGLIGIKEERFRLKESKLGRMSWSAEQKLGPSDLKGE